ncbi:Fic family protein [Leyella stercorea]|jgi:Fic family protein|uniref:Fic family protein n=1 Tax=Leyella stercorea TaxID=363265 RepID=UPI003FEE86E7
MAFEKEIKEYDDLRSKYQTLVVDRMNKEEYVKYNEVLFSTHSCAIEGNSFSVDDTRELKEKGLGMIPAGKTLFEAFEMLDHFDAFEHMMQNVQHPLDETLLKEINRRVTSHTLAYRAPDATPGEYTTTDMAAGDTVFGDHEELIARVPRLLESTEQTIVSAATHPMVVAARFHGFYEYLHPFRDGNGRTGRLVSNYILLRMGHPLLIIPSESRQEYIAALRMIRTEATDEHLVRFFFKMAVKRMQEEMKQKEANTKRFSTFLF